MMPISYARCLWNLAELGSHGVNQLWQGPKQLRSNETYLLLARGFIKVLYLVRLQAGEKQLDRRCGVAVWPRVHHWDLKLLESSSSFFTGMVFGIVQEQHRL